MVCTVGTSSTTPLMNDGVSDAVPSSEDVFLWTETLSQEIVR